MIVAIICLVFVQIFCVFGANILFISAVPSPSHHIWNRALAFGLVEKGHNVTLIGPDEDKVIKPANYSHILLEGVYGGMHETFDLNEFATHDTLQVMKDFKAWCLFSCMKSAESRGLQHLLHYPKDFKFDLIIVDATTGSCLYPLIHRFNYPPTVAVSAFLLPMYLSFQFGNHLYPAYVPFYALPYTSEMNFIERVWNFVFTYYDVRYRTVQLYEEEYEMVKKVFADDTPPMQEIEKHISILLANTDPLLDFPQPITPNIIPVGGLHATKGKQLPKDLEAIVNNAKSGIVVFSLGTNIQSDKLDKDTQKALLDAFSKISQTVLWKFESDIENLPKNVIVRKWLPQNDLLGHSKTKLFIGHGGTLSTQEALYHGVPMIIIPFIVDQYVNAQMIVNKKIGLSINFKNITTENMYNTLKKVLDNPKYKTNVETLSKIYRDRPETPLERAIFWIEFTLRHGGAKFLNSQARHLTFLEASSVDVLLFLVLIAITILVIVYKIITVLSTIIFKKKDKRD